MATIEICVDSLESALEAGAGGADRLELCSALSTGGLTPSLGFLRAVRSRVKAAIHVMVRPRTGDFLYSADEVALMRDDISLARQAGAEGIVFGLLTHAGLVDETGTRELVAWASPLEVTFHRAFDLVPNLDAALEALVRAGVHRVLTSGGARTATEGRHRLADLVRAADGHIIVMPGGGVRAENIQELARRTGAREFHAALRRPVQSPVTHRAPSVYLDESAGDQYVRHVVRARDVRALKAAAESNEKCLTIPELSR